MLDELHITQRCVKRNIAPSANDPPPWGLVTLRMAQLHRIHPSKTPRRLHFIPEWAEKRGLSQADLVREVAADKATVSRWFSGALPSEKYLEPLAALFETEVSGLFRHPDDDWLARFLQARSGEERDRIRAVLDNAFPRKTAG